MLIVICVFIIALAIGLTMFGLVVMKMNDFMLHPYTDKQIEEMKKENEIFMKLVDRKYTE